LSRKIIIYLKIDFLKDSGTVILTIKKGYNMNQEIFQKFMSLLCQLSPENLCCDGEASQAYIKQKLSKINKEWKALEKELGRKVSENEIWAGNPAKFIRKINDNQ